MGKKEKKVKKRCLLTFNENGGRSDQKRFLGHLSRFDRLKSDRTMFNAHLKQFCIANSIKQDVVKKVVLLTVLFQETYKTVRNLYIPKKKQDFQIY